MFVLKASTGVRGPVSGCTSVQMRLSMSWLRNRRGPATAKPGAGRPSKYVGKHSGAARGAAEACGGPYVWCFLVHGW